MIVCRSWWVFDCTQAALHASNETLHYHGDDDLVDPDQGCELSWFRGCLQIAELVGVWVCN